MIHVKVYWAACYALVMCVGVALGAERDNVSDSAAVAALDTQYQAAVKANDYATMSKIMADNFVFLTNGKPGVKADFVDLAKKGTIRFEHQEEIGNSQKVYVWGDTAVVTAELWIKGTDEGRAFESKPWFSDVYVRTKSGWKYACGQVIDIH